MHRAFPLLCKEGQQLCVKTKQLVNNDTKHTTTISPSTVNLSFNVSLHELTYKNHSLEQKRVYILEEAREMENISRGPTFGDFVTILTERSM